MSKCLQTKGMDILFTHHMVTATQEDLKSIVMNITSVKSAADTFVTWTNGDTEEREGRNEQKLKHRLYCLTNKEDQKQD